MLVPEAKVRVTPPPVQMGGAKLACTATAGTMQKLRRDFGAFVDANGR